MFQDKLYCAPPRENAQGIKHEGSTCCLNVAVQILLRIKPFVKLLESKVKTPPKAETSAPSMFVRALLGQAEALHGETTGTYSPLGWVTPIRQGVVCDNAFQGPLQGSAMEAIQKIREEVERYSLHSEGANAPADGFDDIF